MSLQSQPVPPVPATTARIAHAAFRKGNVYMKMRDELGTLFTDADFATLYPRRGQPALEPWKLALVTLMQFAENLSDRQAADAVRARIDWKYALSLELEDAGFDFSVLCEFRARLLEGNAEQLLLDRMLEVFQEKKLLKVRGRQRTDSTHVVAAIRTMNRLELVTETLRAVLNDLATEAPEWLGRIAPPAWYERYSLRAEQSRLPQGDKARTDHAEAVGRDGFFLLKMLEEQQPTLKNLATVRTLQQVWDRHYARSEVGEVTWRPDKDLPRAATAIESPYDPEARHSNKHDLSWTGYKVHLSETCDPDLPRLVTHVHTTVATTQDVSCTDDIHQALADKNLLPGRHLVDAGYVDSELLVSSQHKHEIELFGPTRVDPSWQAKEGGYDITQFAVDWDKQQATCPQGKTSVWWHTEITKPYNHPIVIVRFSRTDCSGCAFRALCTRSRTGQSRTIRLRSREHHEALQKTRIQMSTDSGRREYRKRAGVEGSLSQGVRRCGLRRSRYLGLAKAHLQHLATAAALNLVRAVNHLEGKLLAPMRVSRFARLSAIEQF
jgi:transposase